MDHAPVTEGRQMSTSRMAGWRSKPQNRVCCAGHDRTDYVRRHRRVELNETRQLTREEVVDRQAKFRWARPLTEP